MSTVSCVNKYTLKIFNKNSIFSQRNKPSFMILQMKHYPIKADIIIRFSSLDSAKLNSLNKNEIVLT